LQFFGVSVRGPAHEREGQPNQDAWMGRLTPAGVVVVVCDGLGSRQRSDFGARAACSAVVDCARVWGVVADAPPDLLVRAVHAMWNIRVHAAGRDACATTCLFAVTCADGRLVIAQLGDGLILLRRATGELIALLPDDDRFSNETRALGVATSLTDWRIHVEADAPLGTAVLLCTDGIADDLAPAMRGAFLEHVRDRYGGMQSATRRRAVARDLRRWPTPLHRDDKTLALLWNPAAPPSEPPGEGST